MFLLLLYLFHLLRPIFSNHIHPDVFLDTLKIPIIEIWRRPLNHHVRGNSASRASRFPQAIFAYAWSQVYFVHDCVQIVALFSDI